MEKTAKQRSENSYQRSKRRHKFDTDTCNDFVSDQDKQEKPSDQEDSSVFSAPTLEEQLGNQIAQLEEQDAGRAYIWASLY